MTNEEKRELAPYIEKYIDKFGKGFPLEDYYFLTKDECIELINACIEINTPVNPVSNKDLYY